MGDDKLSSIFAGFGIIRLSTRAVYSSALDEDSSEQWDSVIKDESR